MLMRAHRAVDAEVGSTHPEASNLAIPVIPIGPTAGLSGSFDFIDATGQRVAVRLDPACGRETILSLFGGDETWLRRHFPRGELIQTIDRDLRRVVTDFYADAAAVYLLAAAKARRHTQPGTQK